MAEIYCALDYEKDKDGLSPSRVIIFRNTDDQTQEISAFYGANIDDILKLYSILRISLDPIRQALFCHTQRTVDTKAKVAYLLDPFIDSLKELIVSFERPVVKPVYCTQSMFCIIKGPLKRPVRTFVSGPIPQISSIVARMIDIRNRPFYMYRETDIVREYFKAHMHVTKTTQNILIAIRLLKNLKETLKYRIHTSHTDIEKEWSSVIKRQLLGIRSKFEK